MVGDPNRCSPQSWFFAYAWGSVPGAEIRVGMYRGSLELVAATG